MPARSHNTYIQTLLSNALTHKMLLMHDLKELKIIPANFPAVQAGACARVSEAEEERERYLGELLATIDDVLSDKLKQKPMNTHGPMKIHLMMGGKPYRTATARYVPYASRNKQTKRWTN